MIGHGGPFRNHLLERSREVLRGREVMRGDLVLSRSVVVDLITLVTAILTPDFRSPVHPREVKRSALRFEETAPQGAHS